MWPRWPGREVENAASFLDETLVGSTELEFFPCSLTFPVTDRVLKVSGVKTFNKTCKLVCDSTFVEFRVASYLKLRDLGYDVKCWQCRGGASERQVATDLILTPFVDLAITVPNGNRLANEQEADEPFWMARCCQELSSALHACGAVPSE